MKITLTQIHYNYSMFLETGLFILIKTHIYPINFSMHIV
jgi:hypothetical protein